MVNLFSNIDNNKISEYHDLCHSSSVWPKESPVLHEEDSIWIWIERNHKYNCQLWGEEDKARRINVGDNDIAISVILTNLIKRETMQLRVLMKKFLIN